MKYQKIIQLFFFSLFLSFFSLTHSFGSENKQDKSEAACATCIYAKTDCNTGIGSVTAGTKTLLFLLLIGLVTAYSWIQFKKKLYLVLGITTALIVGASYCISLTQKKEINFLSANATVLPATENKKSTEKDDFKPVSDDFTNTVTSGSSDTTTKVSTKAVDAFAPLSAEAITTKEDAQKNSFQPANQQLLFQILGLFLLIVIIGLTIQYGFVRKLRPLILLSSVVYLGFIQGACPCMVMSLQNVVLFLLGNKVGWIAMFWFLGLLPLTYFFGKVWCGWLCHLGGLQEFLFRSANIRWLSTQKAQKVLKYFQIGLFVTLLVQLLLTRSNLYVHYDPFKVAFNLVSANITGYILLIFLLVASVLIYRPFCRAVCPVGLILGWVTHIPGARKLKVDSTTCNGCKACNRFCKQFVLHGTTAPVKINTEDCILCGECLGSCKKSSLSVFHK